MTLKAITYDSLIQVSLSFFYFIFALSTTYCILTVCCSFVVLAGMEVAAALTDKAHSVSVIGIESVPFKTALGEKVGKAMMKVGTQPSLLSRGQGENPFS